MCFYFTDKSVEDSVNWLKNSNGPWDELQLHWQNTYQYRMSWMKINDTKVANTIFQEWPVLSSPYAIELILQDFDQMIHLDVKGTIWNWPKFVEYLRGMKKSSSYDTVARRLLELSENETTTEGGRALLEFLHLVHLFPPKGSNPDFKKKSKRQSCVSKIFIYFSFLFMRKKIIKIKLMIIYFQMFSESSSGEQNKGLGIQISKDSLVLNAPVCNLIIIFLNILNK